MFIAPKSIKAPKMPQPQFWPKKDYPLNGGLDLAVSEFELAENKTSNCLNVWYKDGELDKRWGQELLSEAEEPELVGWSAYEFLYKDFIIKHTGTKLYKQDPTTGTLTTIYSGLNNAVSKLFKYNGNIYLKQAGNYVVWDGSTATDVVPYSPIVIQNRTPDGATDPGDLYEGYNRLGASFRNSFSGDASSVDYYLTDIDLDATVCTAVVDGVDKTETADFTVNRTTGVVTFISAPSLGTNNVIIKAYKTNADDINSILDCLSIKAFGGQNDNRLFFGNNGTGFYYWTGISSVGVDPTYIPLANYNIVGLTDENITGFGRQQNSLLVIKEREIYGVDYYFDGTLGVFNSYPISDVMGSDCPSTIRTVNNNSVFLSSEFGVTLVQSTNVGNQRNVFPISRNIENKLLKDTDLTEACSVDFDGKYWLCVGDKVYLWDYFLAPYYDTGNPDDNANRLSWWYFDNINAVSFIVEGDELYYVDRTTGDTVKFITSYGSEQYYDFNLGYSALYRYPYRLIGGGLYEFSVLYGNIGVRGDTRTEYDVTYYTNDDLGGEVETDPIEVGSFAWDTFAWDEFTWGVMGPRHIWTLQPSLKGIQYFAVEFSNSVGGRSLNIQSMKWTYVIKKKIK